MALPLKLLSISVNLASRQSSEATKHLGVLTENPGPGPNAKEKGFYEMFWKAGLSPQLLG